MSLQTVVKAGNITNLSDARYCAGMGVEIIGFPTGNPLFEPSKIKEIAGWLSGVKIALELDETTIQDPALPALLDILQPDYLQVAARAADMIRTISPLPLLLVSDTLLSALTEKDLLLYTGNLQENKQALANYGQSNRVILSGERIEAANVLEVLETIKPYGIELRGSHEISPGFKNFDDLSEILELLEVDE
jgi:phosphoribosylanthranilate isomerase